MQTEEIRLECLKLAHRADQSPEEVVAKATAYFNWISEIPAVQTTARPDDAPKVEKNSGPGINRTSPQNVALKR
jgi:hypothetical protein